MMLHKFQQSLLDLLHNHEGDLRDMSLREIGSKIGAAGKAQVVAHHLEQLEKKGLIRRIGMPDERLFRVLEEPAKSVVYIGLYRTTAQCGPDGCLGDDMVIDRVPLSSKTFGISNPDEYFLIKAKGASMEPRIFEGDLVLAHKQSDVDNGEMAVLVHDGMPKIKKVLKVSNKYILTSLNSDYGPEEIVDRDSDFRICGRVRGVIKLH